MRSFKLTRKLKVFGLPSGTVFAALALFYAWDSHEFEQTIGFVPWLIVAWSDDSGVLDLLERVGWAPNVDGLLQGVLVVEVIGVFAACYIVSVVVDHAMHGNVLVRTRERRERWRQESTELLTRQLQKRRDHANGSPRVHGSEA